ncbi:MAG: hypothetical protein JWL60_1855 [Gemmatimonadetes bacterium]|nr:hypothetical protein [Gemmatimonadota bacterium]
MGQLTELHLRACRASIAHGFASGAAEPRLGEIVLRPHQQEAARRIHALLDRDHGCLLADDVGRGKTFVALAVARRWSRPLVVVPAALRDTWHLAMRRAGLSLPVATHESLSRGWRPSVEPDAVVVDESHHFRNPATRRYDTLAAITMRADVLLLSATPVQNRPADLAGQLALFLGSGARRGDPGALARHVVRVEAAPDDAWLPALAPPRWVPVTADDETVLRAVLALPPPSLARDAGDAAALRLLSLVRCWASSRAALAGAIGRRLRVAAGIEQGLECGRLPARAELAAWHGSDDGTVQLGLAALLTSDEGPVADAARLLAEVRGERAALARIMTLLRSTPDPDEARAEALVRLVDAHPGTRVLAFTSLARTARAYHARLASCPGVGLLTASEARIASGRIPRAALLARFAPRAQGAPEPPVRERVTLLVATDLLSEGVNLQDASVVVHLDLPWNPARLAQRVGRARRPSGALEVSSYLLAPPAAAEVILTMERRLRRKVLDARQAIGRGIDVIPALTLEGVAVAMAAAPGAASAVAAMHARLAAWSMACRMWGPNGVPVTGAALAADTGWLAVLEGGSLLACVGLDTGDDPALILRAVAAASGPPRPQPDAVVATAMAGLHAHLRRRRTLALCGLVDVHDPLRGAVERRLAAVLRRAPRHQRASRIGQALQVRAGLATPLSAGAERAVGVVLAVREHGSDDDWLTRILEIVTRPADGVEGRRAGTVRALIAFGPSPGGACPR